MYRNILVPTDGSEMSERHIPDIIRLAKAMSAKVTAVTVSAPFYLFAVEPMVPADAEAGYRGECEKRAAERLGVIRRAAEAAGVPFEGVHLFHEHPYEAIIATATMHGCDLITMASHGRRGVSAVVLGSETNKVLTHTQIPVLVLR